MKILVIDDEKTVLQGLDKLVRTARPDDAVVCYDDMQSKIMWTLSFPMYRCRG